MFKLFKKKNESVNVQNQPSLAQTFNSSGEDLRPDGTLEEARNQPRNEIPRVKAYPFRLLVKSDVTIPYAASVKEIKTYLAKDMRHFEAGVIALAWKGDEESFEVMHGELQNTDYFRRKVTLEYMIYHDLFEKNARVLGEALLDGHEMVVESALRKVIQYQVQGLQEEVKIALQCWPEHKTICGLSQYILMKYRENCEHILLQQQYEEDKRKRENLIYQGSSQCIVEERMENQDHFYKYLQIINTYYPYHREEDARKLIVDLSKEGCGYASLATTLVQWFSERPDMFNYQFGFQLVQDGEYVTDRLMLDFYCMTDEPGRGMSYQHMEERFQKYCDHYSVKMKMEAIQDIDEEAFLQYTKQGYVLLFAGKFTMYFKKYKPVDVNGWHVMNVCDMQADGTMTVVTWGKKYTLARKDIERRGWHFVYVQYFEKNGVLV